MLVRKTTRMVNLTQMAFSSDNFCRPLQRERAKQLVVHAQVTIG